MYTQVKEHHNKILISYQEEDYKIEFKTDKNLELDLFVSTYSDSKYKNLITEEPLQRISFDNIKDFKEYRAQSKNIGNDVLYGDIEPEYHYIRQHFKNQNKYKSRYWYLDIETGVPKTGFPNPEEAAEPILLIQISDNDSEPNYVFAWLKTLAEKPGRKYFYFSNEKEMMEGWISYQHLRTPAITTAWNGDGFDFPYIINRCENIGIPPESISPFGVLEEHKAVVFGKTTKIRKPVGYTWLDYIDCYKKTDPSGKESFSLEYMSKYILGEEEGGKLDYKKEGFKDIRDFINGKYDAELDEVGELSKYYGKENFLDICYSKFVDYAEKDSEIIKKMDKKLGICDMLVNYAHDMKTNIYDVFATIKPWTIYIWNELYERNQFLPNKTPFRTFHTDGGFVFAKPGLHKWVKSEDYTSLYPFCMICLNLSPETWIDRSLVPKRLQELTEAIYNQHTFNKDEDSKNKTLFPEDIYIALPEETKEEITRLLVEHNLIMAPNATFYRRDKLGIVPELVKNIFMTRKAYKKKMLEAEKQAEEAKKLGKDYQQYLDEASAANSNQYVQKIKINSKYGFMAATSSNTANSDISNAITSYGRYNIKMVSKRAVDGVNSLNPEFNTYIVQIDTDAFYQAMDDVVKYYEKKKPDATIEEKVKFVADFEEKVVKPIIKESNTDSFIKFNAFEDSLDMDSEIISDVFVSTGKKRYAARIWWNEGITLSKPKKKVVGLDIKRSDTPSDVRIKLGNVLDFIFDEENNKLISFISEYEKEAMKLSIDEIAIPSGITDIVKYDGVTKAVPMHVRASIVFNNYIDKNNLDNYMRINNGDKIKYVFLKDNPITRSDVIAFNDVRFLYETGLDKFVDYKRLFERTFLNPVKSLTDAIGWDTNKASALKKLF